MARKIKDNGEFLKALLERFNEGENSIHALDREKVDGQLIVSAEHGDDIDGFPVADYYDAAIYDPEEKRHVFGINRVLVEWCKERGWGLDWETPGSVLVFRDF